MLWKALNRDNPLLSSYRILDLQCGLKRERSYCSTRTGYCFQQPFPEAPQNLSHPEQKALQAEAFPRSQPADTALPHHALAAACIEGVSHIPPYATPARIAARIAEVHRIALSRCRIAFLCGFFYTQYTCLQACPFAIYRAVALSGCIMARLFRDT